MLLCCTKVSSRIPVPAILHTSRQLHTVRARAPVCSTIPTYHPETFPAQSNPPHAYARTTNTHAPPGNMRPRRRRLKISNHYNIPPMNENKKSALKRHVTHGRVLDSGGRGEPGLMPQRGEAMALLDHLVVHLRKRAPQDSCPRQHRGRF